MFDLLWIHDVLDDATREEILAAMRFSEAAPATVYGTASGAALEARVRNTRRIAVAPEVRELVRARLLACKAQLEAHFDVVLASCEEPQFLRYEEGDFFVAHQDGNIALLRDDALHRRVSIVLFLDSAYSGGKLTFHGAYPDLSVREPVVGKPGSLLAFRSETTHEVTPVTAGERSTIVSWFRV